jgi:hypothetical protein
MINFSTRQTLLLVMGVLFVAYCLFQARFLILGPGISIDSHQDGALVASSTIHLSGTVRNAAWIDLNGKQIFTDENGLWNEKLIVSEGVSIMTVRVRDRFGRETSERISLVRH